MLHCGAQIIVGIGVALGFSAQKRRGITRGAMASKVILRSLKLAALGLLIASAGKCAIPLSRTCSHICVPCQMRVPRA